MRLLIIGPSLDVLGGQSIQANLMLHRLREEPALQVGFLPTDPRLPGLWGPLRRIRYLRTVVRSCFYLAALVRCLRGCDAVHVFSAAYYSFLLGPMPAILLARLLGKRVILNYHSGEAEDHLRHRRWMAAPIMGLAHAIVVPSGYLVDVFARFGLSVQAIPNVVDLSRFRFRERRPLRPRFLTNRHLEPLYNVGCVLRAFAIVQSRFPESRLTVAGEGSQRAELEDLARRLRLRGVSFVGRVSPERMPELYDAADIYLNGSEIDNMPVSILEAFASGLPVVTTDAGGIPCLVEHQSTGLLVPRGDFVGMAEAATRCIEDVTLAMQLARGAWEQCRQYSWAATREQWLVLYRTAEQVMRQ